MNRVWTVFVACGAVPVCSTGLGAGEATARLQLLNASGQAVQLVRLEDDLPRQPLATVAAGAEQFVTVPLGQRLALVGRNDHSELRFTTKVRIQAVRFDPRPGGGPILDQDARPDGWGIPSFYTQFLSARGFPIVASARVNPYALREAGYLVDQMLSRRPDVRQAMIESGARLCILGHAEFTTDLPEFARFASEGPVDGLPAREFWDARARGTGGSEHDPFCSCGEENLLAYPGDPYAAENILIHEFAHNLHLRGLVNVDPTFDQRLQRAFRQAREQGLWKGKYASVNHHEYFAEGVQSWFDNNRENDHDHNHVNTRAELTEYDPPLAALCREVFGDTVLQYTRPTTRLTGHLHGYDPNQAPAFAWPARLHAAQAHIRQQALQRDRQANAPEPAPEGCR